VDRLKPKISAISRRCACGRRRAVSRWPELRFTPTGHAVANFTVASTPRTFDRQSGQWKDGDALFLRCTIWRDGAEHVGESLTRGDRVVVQGRLRQRSFETRDGDKRTVVEIDVDEIGPSLRYATVKVSKAHRAGPDSPSDSNEQQPPF